MHDEYECKIFVNVHSEFVLKFFYTKIQSKNDVEIIHFFI